MRTFTLGTVMDRKFVTIEVNGRRMAVIQGNADGSTKRTEKELKSEAEAQSACDLMARELFTRGFVEQTTTGRTRAKPSVTATKPAAAPKPTADTTPAPRAARPEKVDVNHVLEDDEAPVGGVAPVLPRLGFPRAAPGAGPAADGAPKKKKKSGGKKMRRKKSGSDDGLDKRVIAAVGAVGVVFVALMGFVVYDLFLKRPTVVGTWKGSRLEYETGGPMSFTQYRLILDEQKRASMTIQDAFTSIGTYSLRGDRLKLTLKDAEGDASEQEYKISLGRATLDLFDPVSGKKMVQLVRLGDKPAIGGGAPPPAAPRELAAGAGTDEPDKAADARLASVAFSPKDGAFNLRHPEGWKPETGSRPDNTYSWARFTRGSAKIQVYADVQGSLMSGSDSARQSEEGSESSPVHTAHSLYKKTVSEEYSDYSESEPTLFKGAPLGEGRISAFTASGGGLFGSKLRGYRVTLLTNNRRVTILCHCPEADFEKLKPTFLAVCRSVSP